MGTSEVEPEIRTEKSKPSARAELDTKAPPTAAAHADSRTRGLAHQLLLAWAAGVGGPAPPRPRPAPAPALRQLLICLPSSYPGSHSLKVRVDGFARRVLLCPSAGTTALKLATCSCIDGPFQACVRHNLLFTR